MRGIAVIASACFGVAVALRIPQGIRSDFTGRAAFNLAPRQDDGLEDIFPFPANQSEIVDASTEPTDNPPQDMSATDAPLAAASEIPRYFIEKGCTEERKAKILGAYAEAKELQQALTDWVPGYNYDIPHTQWLGKDWNSESSWNPWRWNFRKLVGDDFHRLRSLFSKDAPKDEYIYWYCNDYDSGCGDGDIAYSWDSRGFLWSNHYTSFCDRFYDSHTLREVITWRRSDVRGQKMMENFQFNSGQVMLHEIMHYKSLVSQPRTADYAYGPQFAWDLAKDKGTNWAYVNADSYALDALAIYAQQWFKSSMSPVPWRELAKLDAETFAALEEPPPMNVTMRDFGDGAPPGFTAPQSADPDLDFWEEVDPDAPLPSDGDDDEEDDAPELNKAVSIIMEQDDEGFWWSFYETHQGQAAGCATDYVSVFEGPYFYDADVEDPPLPAGAYEFTAWGRACKWSGDGETSGELVCDGERFGCRTASGDAPTNECEGGTWQHEGAFCDFYSDGEASAPEEEEPEEETCPEPYPATDEILDLPAWTENNVCTDICPGGEYDFCGVVDENENPTTGYCQCTASKCTDEGNYMCYQPE